MSEIRLQHNLTMWFSQTYPQYYGSFWSVFNEDSRHKMNQGMHRGVSDTHLFINNRFTGIELKNPGSIHKIEKIMIQMEWGRNIIKNGGLYYIGSDIDKIKHFINGIINIKQYIYDIQDKCLLYVENQLGKRTIKF